MFGKLKKRWNVESNIQIAIILVVFTITGTTTVFVKKAFFELIGITASTPFWVKAVIYVPAILVIYNILLLIIGFLFGQFRFFLEFEKKFFRRIFFMGRKTSASKVEA